MGRIQTKNWLVWAKRSLFGYTVSFLTLDKEYRVEHRFLRSPILTRHKNPDSVRGMKYTAIIYDEDFDAEQLRSGVSDER